MVLKKLLLKCGSFFYDFPFGLVEMVQKDDGSREGWFGIAFNLKLGIKLGLRYPSQVGKGCQLYLQTHFAVYHDRLIEFEFIKSIVDQHLDIVDLGDLIP